GLVDWRRRIPVSVPTPSDGLPPVVTRAVKRIGDTITAGEVLLEVAYRPVIVLPGRIPMLRDLRPGDTGRDVAALQASLRKSGRAVADRSGEFGPSTQAAVADLYSDAGYDAPVLDGAAPATGGAGASAAELVFVPQLPAHVIDLPGRVGDNVADKGGALAAGKPVVQVAVSADVAATLTPGTEVGVRVLSTGNELAGRVERVGAVTESDELGVHAPVTVVTDQPISARSVGTKAEVELGVSSDRPEGLLVPASALLTSAKYGTYVRRTVAGREQVVRVRVEDAEDGLAVVSPLDGDKLVVGDDVVIGAKR
ncbi:hypothetical protein, partial [Nocardioides sp. GCM10030258]